MAGVYLNLGEPSLAERALSRAIQINPRWVPALINLADLYRATGRDAAGGTGAAHGQVHDTRIGLESMEDDVAAILRDSGPDTSFDQLDDLADDLRGISIIILC